MNSPDEPAPDWANPCPVLYRAAIPGTPQISCS